MKQWIEGQLHMYELDPKREEKDNIITWTSTFKFRVVETVKHLEDWK